MRKEERLKAEQARIRKIRGRYERLILKTKTIQDCEDILRILVKDSEIPSQVYLDVYHDVENRGRQIKARQAAIIAEAAAAIETERKMAAHSRQ